MPTTIGRYQVRALLGQGTFGSVYRAFDPKLDREVALKVLKVEMTASPQAVERFLREAKAAAKLRHAHIVTVFDTDRAGKHYYIVSAFIPGRTLASAIVEGGVDPRQAAEWTAQLASALGHAHAQGLVHRDVKPANAMLDKEDLLHLMDFGLAGWIQEEGSRLTQAGAVMGTPHYMAPEQIRGDMAAVGPRSDLYGAGVVLYELLTGTVPFQDCPMTVLPYQIMNVIPPPPSQRRPGLDAALEAICLKAMAKDPARRYQSGAEMAAALRAWAPTALPLAEPMAPARSAEATPSVWSKKTILPPSARPGASTTSPPPKSKSRPAPPRKPVGRPTKDNRSLSGGLLALLGVGAVVLLVMAACVGAAFLLFLSAAPPSTEPSSVPWAVIGNTRPPVVPPRDKPALPGEPPRLTAPLAAVAAKQSQQAWADFRGVPVLQDVNPGGGVTMKLTLLPPGTFTMGSTEYDDEKPPHSVEITQPFYLGVYAVTKGQFAAFVKDDGYQTEAEKAGDKDTWQSPEFLATKFTQTDDDPVVEVTWNDAVRYCTWLSKKTGKTFELPTEAEWEYACRAGTTTPYYFGDDPKDLGEYGWYGGNSGPGTHPVGKKKPNPWGLYDMHGNAWQWCADCYFKYQEGYIKDPKYPDGGQSRVLRGGSWSGDPVSCRSAGRHYDAPANRCDFVGFWVACRSVARTP